MRICAILLDYRRAGKTRKCLDSLKGQGLCSVYVVDNSADREHSRKLVTVIDELIAGGVDYNIRLISAGKNLGFAGGVNYAIKKDRHSTTPHEYYLLINNDAVACPGMVNKLLQALLKDADALLASPCVITGDNSKEYQIWYNRYLGLLTTFRIPLSFAYASGCCILIGSKLINNGKLLDTQFFMYGEDAFLGWQIHQRKKSFRVVDDACVHHEAGASSEKASLFYEYHTARAHVLMARKAWSSPLEVPLMLICKFPVLASRAVKRCIRYRSLIPVAAFVLAWLPVRLTVK